MIALAAKEILPTMNLFNARRIGLWILAALLVAALGLGIRHYFNSSTAAPGVDHVVDS